MKRKMTTKRCGKSGGIYGQVQVKMEYVAAKLQVILRMTSAAYSCRLDGFLSILRVAPSWFKIECLFTGINCCERLLTSRVCEKLDSTFLDRTDVGRCLSPAIPTISHESVSTNHVMLYS